MKQEDRLIPDAVEEHLYEVLTKKNPIWDKYRPAPRPLTRRELLSARIQRIRWAIHDRFFDCGYGDD